MAVQKKKRIKIKIQDSTLDIQIDLFIKLHHIEIALAFLICLLTIVFSSLDADTRRAWIDLLLWSVKALIFGEG